MKKKTESPNDYHLVTRIRKQMQAHPDRIALRYSNNQAWSDISWRQLHDRVNNVSKVLIQYEVFWSKEQRCHDTF